MRKAERQRGSSAELHIKCMNTIMLVRACETDRNLQPAAYSITHPMVSCSFADRIQNMLLNQRSFTFVEAVYIRVLPRPASRVIAPPPQLQGAGIIQLPNIGTFDALSMSLLLIFIFIIDCTPLSSILYSDLSKTQDRHYSWSSGLKRKTLEVFGAQSHFTQHSSVSLPRSFP